jgi:hypothetical protein
MTSADDDVGVDPFFRLAFCSIASSRMSKYCVLLLVPVRYAVLALGGVRHKFKFWVSGSVADLRSSLQFKFWVSGSVEDLRSL